MTYTLAITPVAQTMLAEIPDRRIQQKIAQTIDRLKQDPEKQGKALIGPLMGFRSLRAVGQRYRIIYKVERSRVYVVVVAVGLRKGGDRSDIYLRLQRLVHLKLL